MHAATSNNIISIATGYQSFINCCCIQLAQCALGSFVINKHIINVALAQLSLSRTDFAVGWEVKLARFTLSSGR